MEKSILGMVSGEKYLNPHYDIKAESTSCYPASKGFIGIEINGVRFSNIGEMLCYMNKQRTQLTKAKEIIKEMLNILPKENIEGIYEIAEEAEHFLREVEK